MFKKILVFMTAILCLAGLGLAQTGQTGNIIGSALSPEGEGLPGVSITLTSPALIIGKLVTVTGDTGAYRFMALGPGEYELTFELAGMNTVIRRGIRVFVLQTLTVNVTMELKSVQEAIVVIGRAPTIDRQHVTRAANMDKEFLKSIPAVRTLATYVNMAPGLTGSTAHGGTTMDNSWNLDGVNMVDPATGVTFVNFGLDIMEEISIQTGGLTAEFGSVRGAMINVVTKSGGNKFSGSANFYYNHEDLKGDNTVGTVLEGTKSGNKWEVEPVVTLGGPIIKDKLWFFFNGSFNQSVSFVSNYPYPGVSAGTEQTPIKISLPYPYFKLSFQPGANDKFYVSYNYSDRRNDNRGAAWNLVESATVSQETPTHVFNAQWTKFMGNNFYANLKFGMVNFTMLLHAKADAPNYVDGSTTVQTGSYWRNKDDNWRDRYQVNADATTFIDNFMGTHELKFGGEIQLAKVRWLINGVPDPLSGACYNVMSGSDYTLPGSGSYSYGLVLVNGGFDRIDKMNNYSAFIQDNWSITKNLSLNIGLRFDYNSVVYPAQNEAEGPISFLGNVYNRSITESVTPLSWTDITPRLGLIYDLFSDGKTLLKASFSRYVVANQIGWVNLAHPNGWFGYYQFLNADGSIIPGVIQAWAYPGGLGNPGGAQVGYKDYDLKSPITDEFTLGIEKEFLDDWSIGARYIKKWDRRNIHLVDAAQLDMDKLMADGTLDWSKNWVEVTGLDPYDGKTVIFYNKINRTITEPYIVNPPGADRDYDGFEVTLNKRFSNRWALNASYVYANSRGLLDTDRNSESLGTSGYYKDPNYHINAYGRFTLERRNQFKVQSLWKGPWGINVSGYYRFLQGQRWTRTINSAKLGVSLPYGGTAGITNFAETKGVRGLPDLNLLDLRLEKSFKLGKINLSVFADCFNVFNIGEALTVWANSSNLTKKFQEMLTINDPRLFQLGAKIEF